MKSVKKCISGVVNLSVYLKHNISGYYKIDKKKQDKEMEKYTKNNEERV